jgi:hypothetical protein
MEREEDQIETIKRLIEQKKQEIEDQRRDLEERRKMEDRIRLLILEKERELLFVKSKEEEAKSKALGQ